MMDIPASVRYFLQRALDEDIGSGDVTSSLLIPADQKSTALIISKENFVLAGMPFVKEVLQLVDENIYIEVHKDEGSRVKKGDIIAEVHGRTRSLLLAERVSINVLQHLSGVATLTGKFVSKIKGLNARIVDTRKTFPCMRLMEKYAVRMGGGKNHRFGLYDGILIKDNHIEAVGGIRNALQKATEGRYMSRVEVEVESLKEFKEALLGNADIIMLDNMTIKDIKEAVKLSKGKVTLEVSGNVNLENVREIAETGVDTISVGVLTHSAPAVDISMKLIDRHEEEE